MIEEEIQVVDEISAEGLPEEVDALKLDQWRLVQILCLATKTGFELYYSFGGGYAMKSLKLVIGPKDAVPSITPYYRAAFLYENEIRDLFGVRIERIALDWHGKVYDVAEERPFGKGPKDRVRKASVSLGGSERQAKPVIVETQAPDAEGGSK